MGLKRLLDTNAYTAFKQGHAAVGALVREAEEMIFSTVVLGELLFGFRYGTRWQNNHAELEAFLAHPAVILQPVSKTTADRFGRIAATLRSTGKPIPTNDIWISAHAMETGAELITLDRHYENVAGLAAIILPT